MCFTKRIYHFYKIIYGRFSFVPNPFFTPPCWDGAFLSCFDLKIHVVSNFESTLAHSQFQDKQACGEDETKQRKL